MEDVRNDTLRDHPHIYNIAAKAFQGLWRGNKKQALVISG